MVCPPSPIYVCHWIIRCSREVEIGGTVPELLFEKKGLIPALQQLLTSYPNPTG